MLKEFSGDPFDGEADPRRNHADDQTVDRVRVLQPRHLRISAGGKDSRRKPKALTGSGFESQCPLAAPVRGIQGKRTLEGWARRPQGALWRTGPGGRLRTGAERLNAQWVGKLDSMPRSGGYLVDKRTAIARETSTLCADDRAASEHLPDLGSMSRDNCLIDDRETAQRDAR